MIDRSLILVWAVSALIVSLSAILGGTTANHFSIIASAI